MKSDLVRLRHILDAIANIEDFTRHILIHEYFGVHEETIWDTIQNDLPKLKEQVSKLIAALEKEEK